MAASCLADVLSAIVSRYLLSFIWRSIRDILMLCFCIFQLNGMFLMFQVWRGTNKRANCMTARELVARCEYPPNQSSFLLLGAYTGVAPEDRPRSVLTLTINSINTQIHKFSTIHAYVSNIRINSQNYFYNEALQSLFMSSQ